MFVLLSSPQQLLDVLGDLLGFADDVLGAGQRGIWLHLQIVQLRDGAALPQPAAAPQPPSPAQTAEGSSGVMSAAKISPYCVQAHCLFDFSLCQLAQTIILGDALTPNHPSQSR